MIRSRAVVVAAALDTWSSIGGPAYLVLGAGG